MPLPLSGSCFSKIQIGFTFLVPARLGCPGKGHESDMCLCVNGPLCVCVCLYVSVYVSVLFFFAAAHLSTVVFSALLNVLFIHLSVLLCSSVVLNARVGHSMDVLYPCPLSMLYHVFIISLSAHYFEIGVYWLKLHCKSDHDSNFPMTASVVASMQSSITCVCVKCTCCHGFAKVESAVICQIPNLC